MTKFVLAALVVLNVLLGVGLFMRYESKAYAQIGGSRGDYSAVAGSTGGQAIIYVLEANSGRLVGIRTDPINSQVKVAGTRVVSQDLAKIAN